MKWFVFCTITLVMIVMILSCNRRNSEGKGVIIGEQKTYSFKELSNKDELNYKILRQNGAFILEIYSTGNPSEVILHEEGTYIDDLPLSYRRATGMVKGGVNDHIQWIGVNIYKASSGGKSNIETWFIDGRKGIVTLLFNDTDCFTIDDSGSYICVYNRKESERTDSPVVTIYRICDLKKVNQGICNELHGDRKPPASMIFSNGIFIVEFFDDGPNEGKIELSIP